MTHTVSLSAEQVLTVTTADYATVTITRMSDSAGGAEGPADEFLPINIRPSTSVSLGPFSVERRYILNTLSGVTYTQTPFKLQHNRMTSGIYTGGLLYIDLGDDTKFNITAGSGVIVDNYTSVDRPIITGVQWDNISLVTPTYIADNFTSYVAIDKGGNVVQFEGALDPSNRRDYIIIGLLIHTNNTNLESVSNFPSLGYDQGNVLVDLVDSIGIINRTGNVFSSNGSNLKLNKSIGTAFKLGGNFHNDTQSPNIITTSGLVAPDLFKPYRDGVGGFKINFPLTDAIDPTKWDNGSGTLQTVPGNNWGVHRIYYGPTNDDVIVHYPQATYTGVAIAEAAINGETFSKNPVLEEAVLRGFLIVRKDCTSLADASRAKFIAADKYGLVPAQGSSVAMPGGYLEAVTDEKDADFTAEWYTAYIIDNAADSIIVTLPEIIAGTTGCSAEFWIKSAANVRTVTFIAPDYTYSINGVSGANPDAVTGIVNDASISYLKVTVRCIGITAYLISSLNSVTV